jgi:Zn ribbon nucleic-acid-binding protein
MKKVNILVLVGLAGLLTAVWGPQITGWMRSAPNLTRYPLGPRFYCESCGWHFDENPRRMAPLDCPKCKKATAMKTVFSPGASVPEFIHCKKCQADVPYQLFKWPLEEKRRWEKRLAGLDDGQFLSSDEIDELQKTKLVKTSALEWMTWDEYLRLPPAKIGAVRCVKCGNQDAAQFDYSGQPPTPAPGR